MEITKYILVRSNNDVVSIYKELKAHVIVTCVDESVASQYATKFSKYFLLNL